MGCQDVLAVSTQVTGVLVHSGIGAGAFPFDTGGVGSILACMARLVGWLTVWSFWIAEVTVVLALSNNCLTLAVSSSAGLSGVSEVLLPWIWTVLLLRYTQQYRLIEYRTSFPWYCPVPLIGCTLSMYSLLRNLAVRNSSETRSLSSK